jgi:hypothetical protein
MQRPNYSADRITAAFPSAPENQKNFACINRFDKAHLEGSFNSFPASNDAKAGLRRIAVCRDALKAARTLNREHDVCVVYPYLQRQNAMDSKPQSSFRPRAV